MEKWSGVCNIFIPDTSSGPDWVAEGIAKGVWQYSNLFKSHVKKPRGGRFADTPPPCPRVNGCHLEFRTSAFRFGVIRNSSIKFLDPEKFLFRCLLIDFLCNLRPHTLKPYRNRHYNMTLFIRQAGGVRLSANQMHALRLWPSFALFRLAAGRVTYLPL